MTKATQKEKSHHLERDLFVEMIFSTKRFTVFSQRQCYTTRSLCSTINVNGMAWFDGWCWTGGGWMRGSLRNISSVKTLMRQWWHYDGVLWKLQKTITRFGWNSNIEEDFRTNFFLLWSFWSKTNPEVKSSRMNWGMIGGQPSTDWPTLIRFYADNNVPLYSDTLSRDVIHHQCVWGCVLGGKIPQEECTH